VLLAAAAAEATHLFSDLAGHTTLGRVITGADPADGYATLDSQAANGSYVVRDGAGESNSAIPNAQAGRENRRRSLSYFGQLTDFQLADEESPARVEFFDQEPSGFAASAWRPQEALQPFIVDWSIRQMNLFAGASPVQQGNGSRAAMDFALLTGDQADNMQRNEILWTRALIEGAAVDPNSGSQNPADWDALAHPSCAGFPPSAANRAEASKYTGVQDYDDYDEGTNPYFYDPDSPQAAWADWPSYPGLMDRAQLPFQAAGLDVASYVTNGNHDGLVQGNENGEAAFEDIATGCFKALGTTASFSGFDPSALLSPSAGMLVPPDPLRRFVNKRQIKAEYAANGQSNAHGYEFVDEGENINSNFSASYYAWDPPEAPGFRFISIDTLSEGGIVEQSSSGNLDDPQFQWLERELQFASADDKLIVLFGHHPIRSLNSNAPDEAAGSCTGTNHTHGDTPEHDQNPGCDIDPRSSEPLHFGEPGQRPPGSTDETLSEILTRFPHVIAYVAGHTHENRIQPFTRSGGGVWWGIETSATADWPVQHRTVEVMDNQDGTLSIFGTVLDAASDSQAPAPGSAQAFNEEMLASIGREFAYNDPQAGLGSGDGTADDQNVELLVEDPRTANLEIVKTDTPDPVPLFGGPLTYTLQIANHGPSDASPVTLTDTLPVSVAFDSATPSQGSCMHAAGTVTCDLGELAEQATATVTIRVIPQATGTIVNQASVDSPLGDDNPADNSDTEQTVVSEPTGYPHPKGASPLRASLVPAYNECTAPNRVHGPPLDSPACAPPGQTSQHLTVGTPDANGRPVKSVGFLRLGVVTDNQSTTPDETDVRLTAEITDVRSKPTLADYNGTLQGNSQIRVTDRNNASAPGGGTDAATMIDIPFPFNFTCAATASAAVGATCTVNSSYNAVMPGTVSRLNRAVVGMDQFRVIDGGADGDVFTTPNTLFAVQGVFVP
jgi:uncharacterized repeat protein (TIGR01451 family)